MLNPILSYFVKVLHALFHVPQIRAALSSLPLPKIDNDAPVDSTGNNKHYDISSTFLRIFQIELCGV